MADVGVIGKPDAVAGELPMAWVVTKPGQQLTEQAIADFVAGMKTFLQDLSYCTYIVTLLYLDISNLSNLKYYIKIILIFIQNI